MTRRPALLRSLLLLLALAPRAEAANVLINNGLGPHEAPGNSIADARYAADVVYVRDGGCGSDLQPWDPCPAEPGLPTSIETLPGAEVGTLEVRDSSRAEIVGGEFLTYFSLVDRSSIRMRRGRLLCPLRLINDASGTVEGGVLADQVDVLDAATLAVLDGQLPVGIGVFDAASAVVGGTAAVEDAYCGTGAHLTLVGGAARRAVAGGSCQLSVRDGPSQNAISVAGLGAARVEIVAGQIERATGQDSARLTIAGGNVLDAVEAWDRAAVSIRGGIQGDGLTCHGDSVIAVSGGEPRGSFRIYDDAVITVYGSDFEVDGSPVGPGPVGAAASKLSATLADGTPLVGVPLQIRPGAVAGLVLADPPPVFGSKTVQGCAAAKLKAFAAAAATEAKCEAVLRKGRASLAKRRTKLDGAAYQAAFHELDERWVACTDKRDLKLDAAWWKAQDRAEAKAPFTCLLDGSAYRDAADDFDDAVGQLLYLAAPRQGSGSEAFCLATDAAAGAAVGRYLADALKAKGIAFKKGLAPAAATAADTRLAKSADKLRAALAKVAAKEAKAGLVCGRADVEVLIARADQIAFRTAEEALGVRLP